MSHLSLSVCIMLYIHALLSILTGSYDTTVRVWTHDGKNTFVDHPSNLCFYFSLGQIDCSAEGHSSPVKDVVWISSDDQSENF